MAANKRRRTSDGSAFTQCPVCSRDIPLATASFHIEECLVGGGKATTIPSRREVPCPAQGAARDVSALPSSSSRREVGPSVSGTATKAGGDLGKLVPHKLLAGQYTWPDFLGEEEERELVDWLDYGQRPTWRFGDFNGPSNRMNWGFEVNLRDRTIGKPRRPMPQILKSLAARMRGGGGDLLRDFHPDEANAIDYRKSKGHELLPHFDDRHLNGDILCNLSLLADATMTYVYGGKGGKRGRVAGVVDGVVDVLLPRRSLQVQTGDVRYAWKHSISNANLFGERRVSITFRTCRF